MVKKYLRNSLLILATFFILPTSLFGIGEESLAKDFEREKVIIQKITTKIKNPKTLESGLSDLEKFISMSKIAPAVLQSKILYATVVLDKLHKKPQVKMAIKYMLPLAVEKELAEYQFITANLLYLNEQFDMADSFLQLACTNKNIDKKTLGMCNGGMEHITFTSNDNIVKQELQNKNIKQGPSCLK